MSVQLHPDIDNLDKSGLCYTIYSQLYLNFFNSQDKKDRDHPFGVVEGDDTSIRLKNTAYGFASAIAGAVENSGGEGGSILLNYLKKSGDNMSGKLCANYGFEAGIENSRVLAVYADHLRNESGEITGSDYGVRITGGLHVGGSGFYLDDHRVLSYDAASGTALFDAIHICFGKAMVQSCGELLVGSNREDGVFISPEVLQIKGKSVYHAGNANLNTVDWLMKDADVGGHLHVSGNVTLSGKLQALFGVDLGTGGKTIASLLENELALSGYLSFGVGYGVKISDILVLFRAGEHEIQLGSIGGDLLLGGVNTTKTRLLSGLSDTNGDYILLSKYGDAYFPGSLTVRHNRGADLLSSYRMDANDEGIVVHKRLRFDTMAGAFLNGDEKGIDLHTVVIHDRNGERIIQPCSSRLEHRLSSSFYRPQNRDSYTLFMHTDTDLATFGTSVEACGYIGIDGSYTRLTDEALYFNEASRLQSFAGGIKHYGNSVFRDNLSSDFFAPGFAGNGWAIMLDKTTGNVIATFDEIVARRKFRAYEFEVKKISGTNGSLWVSDSCSGDIVEKL